MVSEVENYFYYGKYTYHEIRHLNPFRGTFSDIKSLHAVVQYHRHPFPERIPHPNGNPTPHTRQAVTPNILSHLFD